MSREIKFRIFIGGRFHYWGFINATFIGPPSVNSEPLSYTEIMLRSEQYIGLTDKNNTEIYKNDIVRAAWHWTEPHVIMWPDDYYSLVEFSLADEIEVIGNIHETLGLLS